MAPRRGPRPLGERISRLLVMLPWLMERGHATLEEMCARFEISERDLIVDLEQVATCGLPPFIDEFVDLYIDDDGTVEVGVPRFFTRPLRLTAPEGFALLAAARAAVAMPGSDPTGPLQRALAKLAAALGDDAMVVDLAQPEVAADVVGAIDAGTAMDITYWSASSDELTRRRVAPRLVFADRGHWYMVADDDRSGAQRTFRLDRITEWQMTTDQVTHREVAAPSVVSWFDDLPDLPVVVLRLGSNARWVVEQHPVRSVTDDGDGLIVEMAIVDQAWLATLLLQVGSDAEVVEPASWRSVRATAARSVLAARYATSG